MSSKSIYTAGDRTPYTYTVTHLPTGKRYYGSRYGKKCHPTDLWVKYFTSSKSIKQLLNRDGKSAFKVEIRKTFTSISECRDWESRVLHKLDARSKEEWLNEHNGGSDFYNTKLASDETKQRMSAVRTGKPKSNEWKRNSSRWYKIQYDAGQLFYACGVDATLELLQIKDFSHIIFCINHKEGRLSRSKAYVTRLGLRGKDFDVTGLTPRNKLNTLYEDQRDPN